jgi:hypothetical protein
MARNQSCVQVSARVNAVLVLKLGTLETEYWIPIPREAFILH